MSKDFTFQRVCDHGLGRLSFEDVILLPLLERCQVYITSPRFWNRYIHVSAQTKLVIKNILRNECIGVVSIGKIGRIDLKFFSETIMNLSMDKFFRSEINNHFLSSHLLCLTHLFTHSLLFLRKVFALLLHCPFKLHGSSLSFVFNLDTLFMLLLGDVFLLPVRGGESCVKLSIRKQFLVGMFLQDGDTRMILV